MNFERFYAKIKILESEKMNISSVFKATSSNYKNNLGRMIVGSAFILITGYFFFYFAYVGAISLASGLTNIFGIALVESNNEIIMYILSGSLMISVLVFFCIPIALSIGFMFEIYDEHQGPKFAFSAIFEQFKTVNFWKIIGLYFVIIFFTFLWSLLLIVPGIIKGISYSQAFLILKNNPETRIIDCVTQSREMMDGKKKYYFVMVLIIHVIVAAITLVIYAISSFLIGGPEFYNFALLIIIMLALPYYLSAFANFFLDINNKRMLY